MSNGIKGSDLVSIIDSRIKKVHTKSLDLSFNEIMDMYAEGELEIRPEYQRLFQWSQGARSRLIESLLLEMPVPPIYVIEEENEGNYLLIDGLQRISSYLHFRGMLDVDPLDEDIKKGDFLKLIDCDIVEELNGKTYNDLPTALKSRVKRAFVRVEVIRKGSDQRFKYHMFKRLNTGGRLLSDQEIRNCTIRLLDGKFTDFIIDLSKNNDFRLCIDSISDAKRVSAYDQELVLRFFALKNWRNGFSHDVSDFLTEYMEQVTEEISSFDYVRQKSDFEKVFKIFARTLKEKSFCYPTKDLTKITTGFSVNHFEAFTIGIADVLDTIDDSSDAILTKLSNVFAEIKCDKDFYKITTGGGKNSTGPLNQRISFVSTRVKDAING